MKDPAKFQQFSTNLLGIASQKITDTGNVYIREELLSHSQALLPCLSNLFWSRERWLSLKEDVEQLSRSLASYVDLLYKKAQIQFIDSSKR